MGDHLESDRLAIVSRAGAWFLCAQRRPDATGAPTAAWTGLDQLAGLANQVLSLVEETHRKPDSARNAIKKKDGRIESGPIAGTQGSVRRAPISQRLS